jgi:hypothetical protein
MHLTLDEARQAVFNDLAGNCPDLATERHARQKLYCGDKKIGKLIGVINVRDRDLEPAVIDALAE